MEAVEKRVWWNYIHEDLKGLIHESLLLVDEMKPWSEKFHDYSFIVFPAAKAYEGFLKTLFFDLKFISEDDYFGNRFRIGKALNPDLDQQYRNESVYDKLVDFCQGENLPRTLWNTWKKGRNMLFHWFPNKKNVVSYDEAKEKIQNILDAMDLAFKGCKID